MPPHQDTHGTNEQELICECSQLHTAQIFTSTQIDSGHSGHSKHLTLVARANLWLIQSWPTTESQQEKSNTHQETSY